MTRRGAMRVGVVGCGQWGANYLRLLGTLPGVQAVACDADPERLTRLARQHANLETLPRARDLLAREDVTAVIIATTASLHFELARDALLAGKDVLVEKPVSRSLADSRELVRLGQERGRVLMVGHTFLYNPAVRVMRDYIARGEIGSLYYLSAVRTHLGLVRSDVSAVWDLATHDISIFNYLLDARPERVSATGGRYLSREREDVAFISLGYPGGVKGSISVSWIDANKVRQVAAVGSRARMVFDDLNNQERLKVYEKGLSIDRPYSDYGEFQLLVRDGNIWSPRIDSVEPLRVMTEHFLECCREGKDPMSDGESGAQVVQVLEAIDRSIAEGGAPVVLPPWPAG